MKVEGQRLCSLPACQQPHIAKGFCQNHYRVFKRHGTPTPPKRERKIHQATGGYLFRFSSKRKSAYLHVEVAEKALGRALPAGAEIHHIDGNPANNAPTNLVICPNHEYHSLLHQRQRALDACGHADWRKCKVCGSYDDPRLMRPYRKQFYHPACATKQSRDRRARIKKEQSQ